MKSKKILSLLLIAILMMGMLVGCGDSDNSSNEVFRIKFKNLVALKDLEKYKDKTVEAIGFLSPISAYDGSFTYLMNLPFQTCPYCNPSDTKITNTIAIFAKAGESIEYTDAAVVVKGTLKLENYTDDYGYEYNYRLVDVTITSADSSQVGQKIALYNEIADKNILSSIMEVLYSVDDNVFHDEYVQMYGDYDRYAVDTTALDTAISELESINKSDFKVLLDVAKSVKEIATQLNKAVEANNYEDLDKYKTEIEQDFQDINTWMGSYEL